ncbi:hypothetical protein MKX03_014854 [Papaver bracteatum]|nr:hypothetical protein MKX03_014854 [Papaver bracteatum]
MNKYGKSMKQKLQKKKKRKMQRKKHMKKQELARAQLGGYHEGLVCETSPILPDVSEGIVCEIMSRLHVKSLMRFKCVCKDWQSLIQRDDFFVDLHYSRSKEANSVSLVRMGTVRLKDMVSETKCMLEMELILPSEGKKGHVEAVGAISFFKYPFLATNCAFCTTNGLLCAMDLIDYRVCVYNISTRESTPWIKSTFIKQQQDKKQDIRTNFLLMRFGLGYDPVMKEHKVIAAWSGIPRAATNELVCEVLTVRQNSWRRIDVVDLPPLCGMHYDHYGYVESVHVDGFICWMHFHLDFEEPCFIQFDVGSEKFRKINILLFDQIFDGNSIYRLIDIYGRLGILATRGKSIKICMLYEEDKDSKTVTSSAGSTPTCNYYWMEETISVSELLLDCELLWKYKYRLLNCDSNPHIPGTDLFMGKCTGDDFSFYCYDWKKKSYSRFKINFRTSSSFYYYYNREKKSYSRCRIDLDASSSPFKNIEGIIFTPSLFPVN